LLFVRQAGALMRQALITLIGKEKSAPDQQGALFFKLMD